MILRRPPALLCAVLAATAVAFLSGCSGLLPKPQSPPALYGLGGVSAERPDASARTGAPAHPGLLLIVELPHADPGLDSAHIVYTRADGRVGHFAHSEWMDTPARMLAPLIVDTLATSGGFRAVMTAPSAAAGDVRLETQVVRLQQEFEPTPSRVRFTLRAYLIVEGTRDVVVTREFDATVAADHADTEGGVRAARLAVAQVLGPLRAFCLDAAATLAAAPAPASP